MGDVWVCSGQSNMEWQVANTNNAEEEIANAKYPKIRLFHIPHNVQFEPVDDVDDGIWEECSPETISNFTAVGYFFGRHLNENLDIPIGLLQTAWGGTVVETWISGESVGKLPEFKERVENLKKYDAQEEIARRKAKMDELLDSFGADEEGMVDGKPVWTEPGTDISKWKEMELPQLWESAGLDGLDGVVWFRKEFCRSQQQSNLALQRHDPSLF
jgi:sialate O-acetylesterase